MLSKRKLSISEMSKDLNISSATQVKFRKGEYVSLQTLESICKYLSVNINDIVSFQTVENSSILYKRLKEEISHRIKGSIYHETQILLTYNSNHIEGSRLSADKTRYIFETNTIGLDKDNSINIDDIIKTQNHFRCIDYMIKSVLEPLSEVLIKDLDSIL